MSNIISWSCFEYRLCFGMKGLVTHLRILQMQIQSPHTAVICREVTGAVPIKYFDRIQFLIECLQSFCMTPPKFTMRTEQLTTYFEPLQKLRARLDLLNWFKPSPHPDYFISPDYFIILTIPRRVASFGGSFLRFSTSMCLADFSYVKVAKMPPFGKELLIRLTVCSLGIISIYHFCCSPF